MSNCKKCESCKYRDYLSNGNKRIEDLFCNYLVITGKRRPCKGGEKCTVHEAGEPKRPRHRFKNKVVRGGINL